MSCICSVCGGGEGGLTASAVPWRMSTGHWMRAIFWAFTNMSIIGSTLASHELTTLMAEVSGLCSMTPAKGAEPWEGLATLRSEGPHPQLRKHCGRASNFDAHGMKREHRYAENRYPKTKYLIPYEDLLYRGSTSHDRDSGMCKHSLIHKIPSAFAASHGAFSVKR